MGIRTVRAVPSAEDDLGRVVFQPEALVDAIRCVVDEQRAAAGAGASDV